MILKFFRCKLFSNYQHRSSFKYRNYFNKDCPSKFELNDKTIRLLEKFALVKFENRRNVEIVETAIEFANGIDSVKTDNIVPLVTVLENHPLKLRKDLVTDENLRTYVLQNAAVVEEDYFVAPPGNIPPVVKENCIVSFEYGSLGELLCYNISNEWTLGNVVLRDIPTFPFYFADQSKSFVENIRNPFLNSKKMTHNSLPFSISCSRIPTSHSGNLVPPVQESKYFRPIKSTELKTITFTTPAEGRQFFHFWQRQRKIWWRKFSADPGRFFLSEIKNEDDVEYTNIQAKFEWGVESIEQIRFLPESSLENLIEDDQEEWTFKVKKKITLPCMIESTTNLDVAAFCFLCDAFIEEERLDTNTKRQFFKFHRKLAPYKIAFVIDTTGTTYREDLKLLAEYLALNIKKTGISVLYVPLLCVNPVIEMFTYYDSLGIPYVVVLKPSTLTDGIFGLRSRETTLQESLHINQLTSHLEMLLRNY